MAIMKPQEYYDQKKFKGRCKGCGQTYLELDVDMLEAENRNLIRKLKHSEKLWLKKFKMLKKPQQPLAKGNFSTLLLCRPSVIPDNYRFKWEDVQRLISRYERKISLLKTHQ